MRGLDRDAMNPSSGKMLLSGGSVLDVADLLARVLAVAETPRDIIITDAAGHAVALDTHGHLPVMTLVNSKVHDGDFYTCVDYDGDVDTGAPKWWVISVPSGADIEYNSVSEVSADQGFLVQVYEGIATDADGTGLTPRNNDRNSAKASALAFFKDPTNPSGGTIVFNDIVGANNPKARFGGTTRNGAAILLRRNTKYGVKVTPLNDNTQVTLVSEFYEQAE